MYWPTNRAALSCGAVAASALLTLVFFPSASRPVHASPSEQTTQVTWTNDRVSVRASDAPLVEVISELARLSGTEIIGLQKLTGRLTVNFADLTAEKALDAMLIGVNYSIQESAGPSARRRLVVRVHSMAGTALPAATSKGPIHIPALDILVAADAAEEAEERADEDQDPEIFDENQEFSVEASRLVLEGAFGPGVAVGTLVQHMENEDNAFIRLEALRALATRPGQVALRRLTEALGDGARLVRGAAVELLGQARDPESLRMVGLLLENDPDSDVRLNALRVLALRADVNSSVHLRAAATLQKLEPSLREAAAQLLTEIDRRARVKRAAGG